MARPTAEQVRKKNAKRTSIEIEDAVIRSAPRALERVIGIIDDPNASHAALNSAAAKILSEFKYYAELRNPTEKPEGSQGKPKKDEYLDGVENTHVEEEEVGGIPDIDLGFESTTQH